MLIHETVIYGSATSVSRSSVSAEMLLFRAEAAYLTTGQADKATADISTVSAYGSTSGTACRHRHDEDLYLTPL